MKSKRSKLCDISQKTKEIVWERDCHRCIICGSPQAMPNAHYIPRSKGGLGIEQNIVTLCANCHFKTDHTTNRPIMLEMIKSHLQAKYEGWNEQDLIYRKEL